MSENAKLLTELARQYFPEKTLRQGRDWILAGVAMDELGFDVGHTPDRYRWLKDRVGLLAEIGRQLNMGYITGQHAHQIAADLCNRQPPVKQAIGELRQRRKPLPPGDAIQLSVCIHRAIHQYADSHRGVTIQMAVAALGNVLDEFSADQDES